VTAPTASSSAASPSGQSTQIRATSCRVGVGPGRGVRIAPGPFPRPAPPHRTCDSHRIRRSTDCHCYAVTRVPAVLVQGVGMLLAPPPIPRDRHGGGVEHGGSLFFRWILPDGPGAEHEVGDGPRGHCRLGRGGRDGAQVCSSAAGRCGGVVPKSVAAGRCGGGCGGRGRARAGTPRRSRAGCSCLPLVGGTRVGRVAVLVALDAARRTRRPGGVVRRSAQPQELDDGGCSCRHEANPVMLVTRPPASMKQDGER